MKAGCGSEGGKWSELQLHRVTGKLPDETSLPDDGLAAGQAAPWKVLQAVCLFICQEKCSWCCSMVFMFSCCCWIQGRRCRMHFLSSFMSFVMKPCTQHFLLYPLSWWLGSTNKFLTCRELWWQRSTAGLSASVLRLPRASVTWSKSHWTSGNVTAVLRCCSVVD